MLFKDFLTLFDLNRTNIVICDNVFDELKFYYSVDDDKDDLFIYDTFKVLFSYVGMRSYGSFVSVPCLFISLDVFFDK